MKLSLFLVGLSLTASIFAQPTPAPALGERTYHVEQNVSLTEIPAGAKLVKWWIAIPDNAKDQALLDFAVTSAPGRWEIVRERDHGNRFLYVEIQNPSTAELTTKISYAIHRQASFVALDPEKAGAITESHRKLLAEDLVLDAPHMQVTPRIAKLAAEACKDETNLVKQAKLLLNAVADDNKHYSIDPSKPKCSVGDAEACMNAGGGCCTDLHSLFIALARARGIPARLQMGYRLQEANVGKEVDPGYRCWAEYFVPNYGWIPTDIVEAENPKGLGRERWFSGLTERRVHLNEGREFDLAGRADTSSRVNTMVIGYAEIDGTPVRVIPEGTKLAQLTRRVRFTEEKPAATVAQADVR